MSDAISAMIFLLGRAPTKEEMEIYQSEEDEYIQKMEDLYAEYKNSLYEGTALDGKLRVYLNNQYRVQSITAADSLTKEEVLDGMADTFEEAIVAVTTAYKDYIDKSTLLSSVMSENLINRLGLDSSPMNNKLLN